MNDESEHFYIIGHRGAAGVYPENSLEGFRYTLTLGVDAIEIDVREHDGRLWVFHDHDVERLTGGSGKFEQQADIGALRLGNGEAIPLLQQVLELTWKRLPLNIEIKAVDNLDLLLELLASCPDTEARSGGMPWILLSSFDHHALIELRRRGCDLPLAPISSGVPSRLEDKLLQIAPWSWHFDDALLDLELVARLRGAGIPSLVFTVNDPARARELKSLGIGGIFTDYPAEMLQID